MPLRCQANDLDLRCLGLRHRSPKLENTRKILYDDYDPHFVLDDFNKVVQLGHTHNHCDRILVHPLFSCMEPCGPPGGPPPFHIILGKSV